MVSSRRVLFLIRNPLLGTHPRMNCFATSNDSHLCALNWLLSLRQLSQRPEGSPSNWTDDIRSGADGTSGISSDRHARITTHHTRGEDEMEKAKERTRSAADTVIDLAKEGTAKAIDAGLELGEIAKKAMDVAWDAAKDTANNIKDATTGENHHRGRRDNGNIRSANEPTDARFKKPAAGGYHFKH